MHKIEIAAVKIKNSLNRVFPADYKKVFSSAIITAGGSGLRLGGEPKQLRAICGKPCILYSLLAFEKCSDINEIIVVSREDQIDYIKKLCCDNRITKLSAVVVGGESRQLSVSNGFSAVSKQSDIVAIHDAARPLIKPDHITKLIRSALRYGAATAATKVSDTVKMSAKNQIISKTVPRDDLYLVQTPQVFRCDLYRVSLALSNRDGYAVTDDCSLAEHAGFPVKLCELEEPNFKLTTGEDLITITSILKERDHG